MDCEDRPATPLIGRDREIDRLQGHVERTRRGEGGGVVLVGEAGIGKTRLLEHLDQVARGSGMQVFSGSGRELERERPFGPIFDALGLRSDEMDSRRRAVASLAVGDGGKEAADVFRIIDEVADLIEAETTRAPVLLEMDDVHWADDATLVFLQRLARMFQTIPLLIAIATRPVEPLSGVAAVVEAFRMSGASLLDIGPLDPIEAIALARAVSGDPADLVEERIATAGGNPLFITELLQASDVPLGDVPRSLRLTVLRRIEGLPDETVDVLKTASVLGSVIRAADLSAVLTRSDREAFEILKPAVREGVLIATRDGFRFKHELVRDAVYGEVPPEERKRMHLAVAHALLAAGADPLDVAAHVEAGADVGDEHAADLLLRAAGHARPRAPAVAADLFSKSLALYDDQGRRRASLLADIASAHMAAGNPRNAEAAARDGLASRLLSDEAWGEAAVALCESLLLQNRFGDMGESATRLLDRLSMSHVHRAALAQFQALAAFEHDVAAARACADIALEIAASSDHNGAAFWAGLADIHVAVEEGRIAHAMEVADSAYATAWDDERFRDAAVARDVRAWVMSFSDDVDAMESEVQEARRIWVASGDVATSSALSMAYLFVSGRWDELPAELEAQRSLAHDAGIFPFAVDALEQHLAARSGTREVEQDVEENARRQERLGRVPEPLALWNKALVVEERDGPSAASAFISSVVERYASWTRRRMLAHEGARLARAAGDVGLALTFAEICEEVARCYPTTTSRAAALWARGAATGDPELYERALDTYASTRARPYERAACLADAALLWMAKNETRGRDLADQAAEIWNELGATSEVARCEAMGKKLSRTRLVARPVSASPV